MRRRELNPMDPMYHNRAHWATGQAVPHSQYGGGVPGVDGPAAGEFADLNNLMWQLQFGRGRGSSDGSGDGSGW
jgi:hypothetical protein